MPLMGLEGMFTQQCKNFLPNCRPWNSSRHAPNFISVGSGSSQLGMEKVHGQGDQVPPCSVLAFLGLGHPLGPLAEAAFAPRGLTSLAGLQAAFGSVRHGGAQSANPEALEARRFTQEAEPFSLTCYRVGTQE